MESRFEREAENTLTATEDKMAMTIGNTHTSSTAKKRSLVNRVESANPNSIKGRDARNNKFMHRVEVDSVNRGSMSSALSKMNRKEQTRHSSVERSRQSHRGDNQSQSKFGGKPPA